MSFLKSIISSVLPPQPFEVAPQIAVAILNLHTNSFVFRKFSDIQTLRQQYPSAVKKAYGCDDTCSLDHFEQVTRAALLAFLWWYYGEFPDDKIRIAARGGIIPASDWGTLRSNTPVAKSWGKTKAYFDECQRFIETEIYHIPQSDESWIRYLWQLQKDKPDLTDRYFSCAVNWMARKLFIDEVKSFRPLSEKIPFYHAIREYLYEASCYCDRRIEQEILLEHF